MCTAATYHTKDHYFGRNLDIEHGYNETVTLTPRKYPFPFRRMPPMEKHFAMIGLATVSNGYPLYYDATNEFGLSMAGLNFPYSAKYMPEIQGKDNVIAQIANLSKAANPKQLPKEFGCQTHKNCLYYFHLKCAGLDLH